MNGSRPRWSLIAILVSFLAPHLGTQTAAASRTLLRIAVDVEQKSPADEAIELQPVAQPMPALSDDVRRQKQVDVSFCVEPGGETTSVIVTPSALPPAESAGIAETLRRWRFQPIKRRGCFAMRISFDAVEGATSPPRAAPKVVPQPPSPDDWVNQPRPHLPESVLVEIVSRKPVSKEALMAACAADQVVEVPQCRNTTFFAKVCFDEGGHLMRATVLQGIPGADDAILATLRQWQLKPQSIPICFPIKLVYDVK